MLSRIRPLGIILTFEDRFYKLGESIELEIELRPRIDLEVIEGRVDLVCEERYIEVYIKHYPPTRNIMTRGGFSEPISMSGYSKRVTEEQRNTYVHSRIVFLKEARLKPGKSTVFNAKLEIQSDTPPHATMGKVKWELVTLIHANSRDATKRQTIRLLLPQK